MPMLNLISLFCGPGGFDEGFRQASFSTKLAYDIDEACIETHCHNHPEAVSLKADLSILGVEEIISEWCNRSALPPIGVIGGPPCQSFSVSNVHQTEDDPRHKLPEHYARILADLNERFNLDFFVFENVPGLVTAKHETKFSRFMALFENAGFRVFEESLNSVNFGVAQDRPRVFIVGINKGKYPGIEFKFPEGNKEYRVPVERVIGNLPEPVYYTKGIKGGTYHPNHWCMNPKSRKFSNNTLNPGEVWGRSFRVLRWDKPSYTVAYGHREVHVHPNCKRRLSVYEAMLLQGFPGRYVLKGTLSDQIRLVSEAVSPPVAKALAESLKEQLNLSPSIEGDQFRLF